MLHLLKHKMKVCLLRLRVTISPTYIILYNLECLFVKPYFGLINRNQKHVNKK